MENLRRRTEREVSDAKTYGVTSFARDMLTVVDNLARALEHFPAEALASADPAVRSMVEGVEFDRPRPGGGAGPPRGHELDPRANFRPQFSPGEFSRRPTDGSRLRSSQVVQTGCTIWPSVEGRRWSRLQRRAEGPLAPKAGACFQRRIAAAYALALVTRRSVRLICRPAAKGRGSGDDAVDAVKGEAARARKRHRVARGQAEGAGRRVALKPADAEQRRVAKRQRHDGGGKLLFVAVLVQAHPRGGVVELMRQASGGGAPGAIAAKAARSRGGIAGQGRPVSGWVGW